MALAPQQVGLLQWGPILVRQHPLVPTATEASGFSEYLRLNTKILELGWLSQSPDGPSDSQREVVWAAAPL